MTLSKEEIKKAAAVKAIGYVQPGMTLGIGTGSTVFFLIEALGRLVKEGLPLQCVPTSKATEQMAGQLGIPLVTLNDVEKIDLTIDGADEVDRQLSLIKGGGNALLQEKMVAAASGRLVIIADNAKLVETLGAFPLPVEVIPYGWKQVQRKIKAAYGIEGVLRMKDAAPLVTDHGHYILDCHFGKILDPAALNAALNNIPGVVDNGLFVGMATSAIIAYPDGQTMEISKK